MKIKEMHEMSDEMLIEKLKEMQRELNIEKAAAAAAGGKAPNPGKIKNLKKTIARISTILSQRKKGIIK